MICCLRGDDGVDGEGKAGSPRAKAGKRSKSKADNAPGGAFGSPVPMSPTSDDEEFHDAKDTLDAIDPGSPKGASHRRTFSAALRDANAIALEDTEAADERVGDVSRCVIPRRDIPFEDPGSGTALSWSANPEGRGFRLRGKKYKSDRKKFPSASPLFDVVQVLALRSDAQTLDMGEILYGGEIGASIHGCPTVYIANLMLPDYPPYNPVFGKYDRTKGPDGPGQHICVVARMTDATREALRASGGDPLSMPPEVALMFRHFNAQVDENGRDAPPHLDASRHVTKMVCMVAAGQEELPWAVRVAIGQGNGKPFMVNKTGFFTKRQQGESSSYFEIGVNAHNFGPVATNGLRNCHGYFSKLVLDIGVTLQGDSEAELPERLLFAFRAVKPDLTKITVHVDELRRVGGGRNTRPWLDWDAVTR